jgi:hypothetical protein
VLSEEAEQGRELFNGTQTADAAGASCHRRDLGDGYNWFRPNDRQTRILPGLSSVSTALRWDGSVGSLEDELRLALAVSTEGIELANP